jgi:hypothetical protein
MSNSIQGNSDSQPSFSWPRRLAILACLIVGCVFSFRAMTPDVAAKVTSETSAVAEIQASVDLSVPVDGDVKLVTKNIEDIQAGDLVLARDEHGTAIGLKPVKETYQRVSHHLRHLTFETPDGKQQTLSTTDEHPFWSVTAEEFVEAGSLIVGHSVAGPTGETQTLVSSAREEFPDGVPVFNFQVTDCHTYFVAASADKTAMLVHNAEYEDMVDLYRAVSPEEFADIMTTGNFNLRAGAMEVKQFGHNLDEVLALANTAPLQDAAAIVKTRVPRSVFDQLDHTPVDESILRSGATTAGGSLLDLLNRVKAPVEHAF